MKSMFCPCEQHKIMVDGGRGIHYGTRRYGPVCIHHYLSCRTGGSGAYSMSKKSVLILYCQIFFGGLCNHEVVNNVQLYKIEERVFILFEWHIIMAEYNFSTICPKSNYPFYIVVRYYFLDRQYIINMITYEIIQYIFFATLMFLFDIS